MGCEPLDPIHGFLLLNNFFDKTFWQCHMTPIQLLQILQLNDSLFPLGAFAYSDGLETALHDEWIKQGDDVTNWMNHYIWSVFVPFDGRAFLKSMNLYQTGNQTSLIELDHELSAMKVAAGTRTSSITLGKRLLKSTIPLYPQSMLPQLLEAVEQGQQPGNLNLVQAAVATVLALAPEQALLAFGYAKLAGMLSAALRMVALGQQEGQQVLQRQLFELTQAANLCLQTYEQPLQSFSPVVDVLQLKHRFQYSRLFRS